MQNFSPYLREVFIFSRYSSSHACVLIARIPETTWFISEMRRSDLAAVRRRSAALTKDSPTKYGTSKLKKRTPISACQPMKYKSKQVTAVSSMNVKQPEKNKLIASSSNRWTSFDIRSMTCPVENSNNACLLRRRVWRKKINPWHNFGNI